MGKLCPTTAYVNGAPQGVLWHDKDNWTAYVSPYMVVSPDRFTKHYYVGAQRIASKIGVGEFNNLYDASKPCVTAGQKDYAERVSLITQSRDDYNAALGIAPGPPTAKGIYGEAEYSGAYGSYSIKPLGNYDVPAGWPSKPYKRPHGGTPGAPVMYQKPSDPDETGAGYGYSNAEGLAENDVYFYHSDHLGSTSYITDKDGNAVQYIAYKPFGETLIDEHSVSYDSPWKFNGKEWDSETGLYYYGARYYEPGVGLWYGVDALTEKYPSVGGYVYCVGNPIRYIDFDGNEPEDERKFSVNLNINVGLQAGVDCSIGKVHTGLWGSLLDLDVIGFSWSQTGSDAGQVKFDITSSFQSNGVRLHQGISAEAGVESVVNLTFVDFGQTFVSKYTDGYEDLKISQEFMQVNFSKESYTPECLTEQRAIEYKGKEQSTTKFHLSISFIMKIEFDIDLDL